MGGALRPALVLLVAVGIAVSSAGCGDGDDADVPVVTVGTRWASANAASVEQLLETHPIAFVGTVVRLEGQRFDELFGSNQQADATRDLPSLPISMFEVRVDEAWTDALEDGQTVTVQQAGGTTARSDGSLIRIVLEFDEPLTEGATYLFFAVPSPTHPENLVTSPFARLEQKDGRFQPLNAWRQLGAMERLAGLAVEPAGRVITAAGAAIAEGER